MGADQIERYAAPAVEVRKVGVVVHDTDAELARARILRDQGYGARITYSPKVFIPVTQLCRDVCHYCTFAKTPSQLDNLYLPIDEILETVRSGARAGCREVLLTLGEKPELEPSLRRRHNLGGIETRGGRSLFRGERGRGGRRERLGVWAHEPGK